MTLPDPKQTTAPAVPQAPQPIGSFSKETGPVSFQTPKESPLPITDIGFEIDLPKEVVSAGVVQNPQSIQIPKQVVQQGVVPSGTSVPMGNGSTVILPLADEKIKEGLTKGVGNSFRWFAEWCVRQMKMIRLSIKKPAKIPTK